MGRYAIYAAPPPDSALWRFGSAVLGYDAATGAQSGPPADWAEEAWRKAVQAPRIYGFHATIKAPFRLAEGCSAATLVAALDRFCAARQPVEMGALQPRPLGEAARFIALMPQSQSAMLHALEADAVTHFDMFRAPLSEADIARRKPQELSEQGRANLTRFGYPHIFEDFRLHYTLAGPLKQEDMEATLSIINLFYEKSVADPTHAIEALCLFGQGNSEQPFRILHRARFGG